MLRASRRSLQRLLLQRAAATPAAAPAAAQRAAASSAAGGSGAAPELARRVNKQWALALAGCLGALGAQLIGSGGATAACEAPTPASAIAGEQAEAPARRKTRIVVLGTGWGAVSFLKSLDPKTYGPDGRYELIVVSPRSYFLYTPLLPSAAAGTVQERSIMEPVRNLLNGSGTYFQAEATTIDPERRVLTCAVEKCAVCTTLEQEAGKCAGKGATACAAKQNTFELPYDVLICGVGSVNNTFGIKGVQDHCFFLKSIDDAHNLRVRISRVIEHAGLPHLTPEERRRHLNFVVVGGGPTGVELAAELHDFVQEDVGRLLPHLKSDVRITVVDTMDHLLGAFDRQLSEYTASHFSRAGIDLQLGTMVKSVDDGKLTVSKGGQEETLPFGTCVWATGVAMHPLVRGLKETLQKQLAEVQNSRTGVVVDGHLRVKGTAGTIFCLGDAAVTHQEKSLEQAAQLFASADKDGDQRLSRPEVCRMLKKVKRQYPQFGELAALLEEGVLDRAAKGLWGTSSKPGRFSKHIDRLERGLNFEDFKELLGDMDTLMRSLPPTAQVASQEGKFLAQLFSEHHIAAYPGPAPRQGAAQELPLAVWVPVPEGAQAFHYRHMGSFAYVGVDHAILDLPTTFPFNILGNALKGWLVGLTWRSFETWRQVSLRNRLQVQSDWIRTKLFGRNITEA